MIRKLAILGVGLIGGSLALALRQSNACEHIVGCDRVRDQLERAVALNVIDSFCLDPADAVKDAEMVVLAVPMGSMALVMSQIADHLPPDAIVTDTGSSKASVVAAANQGFGGVPDFFVPGHPIAGREKSGVEAALANLFVDHKVILTPLESTSPKAIENVTQMWEAAGAQVQTLGVEQHDQVLAATSHLPHVLAFSLVDTLAQTDYVEEIFQFAAGGFRDFSRIASSDPVMWRDICLENKSAILNALRDFQTHLDSLANLIEKSDGDSLRRLFANVKRIRDTNVMKHKTKPE
jgi:prephenate dehydrogenase